MGCVAALDWVELIRQTSAISSPARPVRGFPWECVLAGWLDGWMDGCLLQDTSGVRFGTYMGMCAQGFFAVCYKVTGRRSDLIKILQLSK